MPLITDRSRKWWTLVATALALFVVNVDFFGVAVLLPAIGRDFHVSTNSLEWVINGFVLFFAAPLIAVGRLGDLIGRQKVLLIGLVVFLLASLGCALSPSMGWLVAARLVQGAGAAMFFANSLAIVSNAFPPEQRGTGIGLWTAMGLVGGALGPVLAGTLTAWFDWTAMFYLNVPIAGIAIALILLAVRESRDEAAGGRVDWPGFATITIAAVALVYAIERSAGLGWSAPAVWGALIAAAVFAGLFVWIERTVRDPLIAFGLFRDRDYVIASFIGTVTNYAIAGVMFFMALYLQHVAALSTVATGLSYLTISLPFVVLSPMTGRIVDKLGARLPLVASLLIYAAGLGVLATLGPDPAIGRVIAGMTLVGIGMAVSFNASTIVAMLALPESKAGAAGGVLMAVRHVGQALGLAIMGTMFKALENDQLTAGIEARGGTATAAELDDLHEMLSGSPAAEAHLRTLDPVLADHAEPLLHSAFAHGLFGVMLMCLVLTIAAAVVAFGIRPPASE